MNETGAHAILAVETCRVPGCPNEATGRASYKGLCGYHASEEARRRHSTRRRLASERADGYVPLAEHARDVLDAARRLDAAIGAIRQAEERAGVAREDLRRSLGALLRAARGNRVL